MVIEPETPLEELQYFLRDSNASCLVADLGVHSKLGDFSEHLNLPILFYAADRKLRDSVGNSLVQSASYEPVDEKLGSMVLYTSGTTGK